MQIAELSLKEVGLNLILIKSYVMSVGNKKK